MASGAMKLKVVDSEKTSKLFLTNVKENMVLERNLRGLDIAERTVVNRISSNQKVTYRRFQAKLQRTELMSAKLRGDTEKVNALKQHKSKYSSTLLDDEEVNEVLKRIWRNGSGRLRRRSATASDDRRVKSAVTIRTLQPAEEEVPEKLKPRPHTAIGNPIRPPPSPAVGQTQSLGLKVPQRTITVKKASQDLPVIIAAGGQPQFLTTGPTDEDDVDAFSLAITENHNRPSVHHLSVKNPHDSGRRSSALSSARSNNSAADFLNPVDSWDQVRLDMLHQHRQQVQSANYSSRIRLFCKSLGPFTNDKERFIEDYYYTRLKKQSTELLYNNFVQSEDNSSVSDVNEPGTQRQSVVSDADIRRYTGNPHVRNLTMKRLNFDFPDLNTTLKTTPTKQNHTDEEISYSSQGRE